MTSGLVAQAVPERVSPLELPPTEFRQLGHELVDRIADFLSTLRDRPVTTGETPAKIRALLGTGAAARAGAAPAALLPDAAALLFDHSLFNGHPAFHGVHHLVGGADRHARRSARRRRESQRRRVGALAGGVRDRGADGALGRGAGRVSHRLRRAAGERRQHGQLRLLPGRPARHAGRERAQRRAWAASPPLRVYASAGTHTWIQKAADLFGLGTDAIRWIPDRRAPSGCEPTCSGECIREDLARGDRPIMVVGTAGSVSTGAVDPIRELAEICRDARALVPRGRRVRRAGGGAARRAGRSPRARAWPTRWPWIRTSGSTRRSRPDACWCASRSGCARRSATTRLLPLRDRGRRAADQLLELGLQNSRGFRALKVWLGLRQAGREGYVRMIGDDCRLAASLHRARGRASRSSRPRRSASASRPSATCRATSRGAGGGGGVPQRAQRGAARAAQDRRRGVRDQRGGRRPLPAARLHRQLPHHRGRRRGDPGDRGRAPAAPWTPSSPREDRLEPTSSIGPRCCWSARTSS